MKRIPWNKGLTNETDTRVKLCSKRALKSRLENGYQIGDFKISHDYRWIKLTNNNWIAEHRYVVEKYIERKLKRTEIVHHIDGNKLNNNLENLYVFHNKESHTAFETLVRNNLIDRYYFKSNLEEFKNVK